MKKRVEIICSACGEETLLRREPVYDGFTKAGESLTCSSCGHEYAAETDVPFKPDTTPGIFTQEDKSPKLNLFSEEEGARTCRHCGYYVVNPFTQQCGRHKKYVEATDFCNKFETKESVSGDSADSPF